MLTPGIHAGYQSSRAQVEAEPGVERVAHGADGAGQHNAAQAALYVTDAAHLLRSKTLQAEMFGPASIVVKARDIGELLQVADSLDGQLTATLHLDEADHDAAARLLPVLERKCGRILANGYPTGVEVCHAMVHGGPFPAPPKIGIESCRERGCQYV